MTELDTLAKEVGASGRTLRRAAARGAIRSSRSGKRRVEIAPREFDYVRRYWALLGKLHEELRTLSNVRLAVVFGSVARGEATSESDLDVLVKLRQDDFRRRAELRDRLALASERAVQVVGFDEAVNVPLLLADVLRDGRVIADRDELWADLKSRRATIQRAAQRAERQLDADAWAVLAEMAVD